MKCKPILFSTPMVQAILNNRKTMTRRVMNPQPSHHYDDNCTGFHWFDAGNNHWACSKCGGEIAPITGNSRIHTKYQTGDILWVRETHYRYGHWVKNGLTKTGKQKWKFSASTNEVRFFDDAPNVLGKWSSKTEMAWWKRPGIYLPTWACRIWLRVSDVRAERLQDISECDAYAEGADSITTPNIPGVGRSHKQGFGELWNSINATRGFGWDFNPWVWVITFERVERPDNWDEEWKKHA